MIVRPFATTTPESFVFFPATSPLPPSVSTNLYVASSLISSVTAPSVALPPPPSAPPTGRNHPLQVPTSSRGTKERDTSDCVRLATASWVLSVAQPASKTIRAVEARSVTISRLTIEVFLPFWKHRRDLGLPTRGRRSNCEPSAGRAEKIGVARASDSGPEQRMPEVCGVAQLRWAIPSRLLRTAQQLRDEAEAPHARVELGAADTEGDRSPGLVALRAPERLEDRLLLNLGQRLDDRRRARDGGRAGQAHGRGRRGRGDPEVGGGDEVSVGEDERALDGVLQFTDVAWPAVRHEEIVSLGTELCLTPSHPARKLAQEVVGQHEDIVRPLPQGGEMDAEDGEPVVEITAKTPIHDGLLQIVVGRCDEPDVSAERRRSTDTLVLALLEDAQELGLDSGRQLADLVEE